MHARQRGPAGGKKEFRKRAVPAGGSASASACRAAKICWSSARRALEPGLSDVRLAPSLKRLD
ncbi:hypothetical protein CKY51_15075 [Xanthomonas maliensis]|nr:hypothetical protein CKY51_15075 [Xanthomonas maliensis]